MAAKMLALEADPEQLDHAVLLACASDQILQFTSSDTRNTYIASRQRAGHPALQDLYKHVQDIVERPAVHYLCRSRLISACFGEQGLQVTSLKGES